MAVVSTGGSLGHPKLLEKIDKLFELNIGQYVDLPQLIVVGDQSSGKSSVLEGLTALPFPRDSGLCTRFATQIRFRRSLETKTAVSIIPASDSTPDHSEKLKAWKMTDSKVLDRDNFVKILKDVYDLMGLGSTDAAGTKKTFSEDVLAIEICDPDQDHLSVIDVPGIFKRTTKDVTTKADIAMVRSMVLSYMKNLRSVILAVVLENHVVPANVDIATQEILEIAEECDPKGQRTLGVLTKPDLIDKGAEHSIVSIVQGSSHPLNLGWCIVRNPGQQELSAPSKDRHTAEKEFFQGHGPWRKLPKDRVGTNALRLRLVEILGEMVKAEVSQKLKALKKQREALGPCRESREQQYNYLLDLASQFQDVASLALKANYGSEDVFDGPESLKLATAVVNRNASFSDDVAKRGHTMTFKDEKEDPTTNAAKVDPPSETKPWVTRLIKREFEELEDVLQEGCETPEPSAAPIMEWLEQVYNSFRGFELGSFDASLLSTVWRKQSANWDALAHGYISDIVSLVHAFTIDLLNTICMDERVRRELTSILQDSLTERYKRSIEHINFILYVERNGFPLTNNHYFSDNLEKSREQRTKGRLEKVAYIDDSGSRVVKLDATLRNSNSSNLEHTISDLHDILKSYYKVARKRFVDVVCMQAANHYLVNGPDAPLKVFSPTFVSRLTTEQLDTIAGEESSTRRKRAQLKRDIGDLEQAKKVLL